MEELNKISEKVINEIQNTETKNIVIKTKEILTPEQRMAIDTIRRVKNPFKMLTVKDIMNDLGICESIAYKTFRRDGNTGNPHLKRYELVCADHAFGTIILSLTEAL